MNLKMCHAACVREMSIAVSKIVIPRSQVWVKTHIKCGAERSASVPRNGELRGRGRRRQPAGALVQPRAAGARLGRQAALRARAQRAVAGGAGAPPPLARAARAQLACRGIDAYIFRRDFRCDWSSTWRLTELLRHFRFCENGNRLARRSFRFEWGSARLGSSVGG